MTTNERPLYDTLDPEHRRAVGIVQLYPLFSCLSLGKIWILQDLYIDEAHRGMGYGKALLDHIKQFDKKYQPLWNDKEIPSPYPDNIAPP